MLSLLTNRFYEEKQPRFPLSSSYLLTFVFVSYTRAYSSVAREQSQHLPILFFAPILSQNFPFASLRERHNDTKTTRYQPLDSTPTPLKRINRWPSVLVPRSEEIRFTLQGEEKRVLPSRRVVSRYSLGRAEKKE